ncbi:LacI family DNA-binding transcriptional regulator [Actinophytocola oryzae]|uniref:LacI family transcriptional regulator n=1 Tax=Actinophytocola oryzae TaxID=502181 RepID=A0A4R7W5S6_9PSEU|nr:LacI family DNA-binding transcriptional regulator [Actinophytocola oryzae]TDV57478.1 LacI family transcriptional regulator [Actinophytocola oryzae]
MYVSLRDVAARAGVSFQTAGKVLNGRSGVVSASTRERILKAAADLGYVPNAMARGLVRQSSVTVGVVADDFADLAVSQFVLAAQRAAASRGHAALISSVHAGVDAATAVRKLLEYRVDGILVAAPTLEDDPVLGEVLRGRLPVVSFNRVHGGGIPTIGSDHAVTGTLAAEHLLGLGHRRIGTITGPQSRQVVGTRTRGFRAVLDAADVPLPDQRVVEADWTYEGGWSATHRLLDADPSVTAVFVHNDTMAVGVLKALHERGLDLPAECSVVGCDDLSFAGYLVPPLTTVRIPFQETGERAAQLLVDRIGGKAIPSRNLLPVELVVRESTSPPNR